MTAWHWSPGIGWQWDEALVIEPLIEQTTTMRAVSAPVSAVAVLAANGIKRPDITIRAAKQAGLDLPAACVMLMAETGGGRMVWGSDAVQTGGTYAKGGPVTQANYLAYRAALKAGKAGRQGVGDTQLTSSEFQDRGDQLGGCWDPYANQLSGFTGLASRISRYGTRNGFRAYNGSGPAAEAYAAKRMAEYAVWQQRLAGVPTDSGDSDLDARQDAMLTAIYQQMSGSPNVGEWPGWPSWGGGTTESLTAIDYLRRGNVETRQVFNAVQTVLAQVSTGGSPSSLSDADVQRIALAVAALLGTKLGQP